MKHTEVQMQAHIVSEIMWFNREVDSACGQIVKIEHTKKRFIHSLRKQFSAPDGFWLVMN